MRTKLRKIGNSKGIILSQSLMEQFQFGEEIEIVIREDGLLLIPVKALPREQWEKQFQKAIKLEHKPEKTILESFPNQFDKEDWTW